ncbi:hypothetical protein EGW08_022913 [Elysia chlorotica]|uniref:Uncharacterized protein n=1 Tax=Elysia chlorotica TaxID=188477 RepID=A0A433SJP7_ELYCH|nr:hypothetical protein EGW08_022913 [Elysia chlorotica]
MGQPEVNMSIWREEKGRERKLLTTKQGTRNLRYNPLFTKGMQYSCSLQGSALQCLGQNEPPRRIATAKATEHVDASEKREIDWFLVLYSAEIFAVIYIILWTISNFCQHMRLLMWGQRMQLERKERYLRECTIVFPRARKS